MKVFKFLKEHKQFTLFLVLALGVAAYMSDQLVVMQHGKVVDQGDRNTVLSHPASAYTKKLLAAVPEMGGARFV